MKPARVDALVQLHQEVGCRDSEPRLDPSKASNTPAARSPETRNEGARQPRDWRRALPFFCGDLSKHRLVQLRFRQELLQLGVLVLQRLQPLGVRHIETAILGLPFVEGALEIPYLRQTSVVFAPASCSRRIPMICSSVNRLDFMSTPSKVMDSTRFWRRFRGSRHC